ncbi:MAG: response regulator [Planctomycetales bacterium]|nr:response regulator [Planctomycetales bacterium]
MLVVSRKPRQTIYVDGTCRITVLRSSCKLGIEGNARVLRGELLDRVEEIDQPRTIYLVDDDADLTLAYRRYLEHAGFQVEAFNHGGDFLEHASERADVSAAILDLRLAEEDIDGLQILQQLRSWNHDYPVILLTGYGDIDSCRRAFHGGCYTFLQKPLPPSELTKTLGEAIDRYERGEYGKRHSFNVLEV